MPEYPEYTDEERAVRTTQRDLPVFDNQTSLSWSEADSLVDQWTKLDEDEFQRAASGLTLEQMQAAFIFVEGVRREHYERGGAADKLVDRLRMYTLRASRFGLPEQDEAEQKRAEF